MTAFAAQTGIAATASRVGVAVRAEALSKEMDGRSILHELEFEITAGSYVSLIGANGAGKTTLLHLLAMLTTASSGQLHLFGEPVRRNVAALRARIGLIGHQAMVYRDLSAWENLMFFGRLYGLKQPAKRATELLQMVQLADRAEDAPKTFSRGMLQRLAIARALMHDPDLLLADEPFSGLDVPSVTQLEGLLAQLHAAGKTIVLTNHDIAQSLRLAERVIVMRRGRIVRDQPTRHSDVAVITRELSQT